MNTVQVRYTLQELSKWSKKSTGISLDSFNGDIDYFLRTSEEVPPMRLDRLLRPLIVDEAIDIEDIIITIVDEDTGEEYRYNPVLDTVFKGIVPKPYLNSV